MIKNYKHLKSNCLLCSLLSSLFILLFVSKCNAQIFVSDNIQITGKEQIYSVKDSLADHADKNVEIYVAKNTTFVIKEGTNVSNFSLKENVNNENKTLATKKREAKISNPISSIAKKKPVKRLEKATHFISNPFNKSDSSLVLSNINGKDSVVVPISNYKGKTIFKNTNEKNIAFVEIGLKKTNFSLSILYRTFSFYNKHTSRPPPANFS